VIRKLCQQYAFITGILLENNVGQQNALLAGIRHGTGTTFVTIDDDLQNDPEDIPLLLKGLSMGYDVVYGVPRTIKQGAFRRIGTFVKEGLFFLVIGKPVNIRLTSFRAMNQQVAAYIQADPLEKVYLSARTLKYTHHIKNITVKHHKRQMGHSNYSFKKLSKLLLKTLLNYGKMPLAHRLRKTGNQYVIKEILSSQGIL
jgi:undecaprenyl-phosphate 4-deoxy-4-formamido-L-arabinose transferase